MWNFYGFFEDFSKTTEKTAKTVGVVCFEDNIFTLSIDRYFLKEGGIVKS